jgi:hypothetical protein
MSGATKSVSEIISARPRKCDDLSFVFALLGVYYIRRKKKYLSENKKNKMDMDHVKLCSPPYSLAGTAPTILLFSSLVTYITDFAFLFSVFVFFCFLWGNCCGG